MIMKISIYMTGLVMMKIPVRMKIFSDESSDEVESPVTEL